MVNIPVNFRRMAAAFDEMARFRSSESSGSEHSADLSDLVNSFFEREIREQRTKEDQLDCAKDANEIDDESDQNNTPDFEIEDSLKNLLDRENDENDVVRRKIRAEVEMALVELSGEESSSPDFKRRLMARLRSEGFDAGLCKSRWEKNGRTPSGNYEYMDVNCGDSRYIVEVFLAGEFTIARPTGCYSSLLDVFPQIYVGKAEELKQVVKLMCRAMRKSMKSVDLNVPPWRRPSYMSNKWFGFYRRTVNEIGRVPAAAAVAEKDLAGNRLVGFAPPIGGAGVSFYCREDFAARSGGRIGNLAAAFNLKEMHL